MTYKINYMADGKTNLLNNYLTLCNLKAGFLNNPKTTVSTKRAKHLKSFVLYELINISYSLVHPNREQGTLGVHHQDLSSLI